ncbi:hypothetical protein FRC10_002642 [Ceratobasidium sp. 414]|nr:hypothetical protein FRC10_002642 [Ceratobasidium sp. 414]
MPLGETFCSAGSISRGHHIAIHAHKYPPLTPAKTPPSSAVMTAHSSPDVGELSAHSAQEDPHSLTHGDNDLEPPPSPAPSYPHSPTPAYTSQPHTTERTVTRGPPTAAELTGHVEYTAKRFRVLFGAQQPGRTAAQGPEYARGSKVRGVVHVVDKWRDRIGSVDVKVCSLSGAFCR